MSEAAALQRAEALIAQGQLDAGLAVTEALVRQPQPSHLMLAAHAGALKLAGRREEALAFDEQAITRFASSPIAWHNYAATLDDLGRAAEAVEACERAFRLGIDTPQTFAVYARALRASGDHERSDYAYRQSLMRAPGAADVAIEFANYVWMRGAALAQADAILDGAFHGGGPAAPLLVAKATLYEAAGDPGRAAGLLEAASQRMPGDLIILLAASEFALRLDRVDDAKRYVRLAQAVEPASRGVIQHAAILDLARGRAAEALARLKAALARHPQDQSLWGWAATAARAAGDPLYESLCDYDAVVGAYDLAVPAGWSSLEAFLSELSKALKEEHSYQQHPIDQSLRHGSQSMHLLTGSSAPAIRAFFQAIDTPIREHMARLGQGDDPLRRRNTLDYRIQGAWSVRLRPGGFHRDHFHPQGWLSSAFYVETPDHALESEDRQGWIRFGTPPFATEPPMEPAHYVKPKPGRLVLFPSYMWHGTVPFATDENRLTIAFDAVPK